MRVTRKDEIPKLCRWYLENIKEPARTQEIIDYAISNKIVGKHLQLTIQRVSQIMRCNNDFISEKNKDGINVWRVKK